VLAEIGHVLCIGEDSKSWMICNMMEELWKVIDRWRIMKNKQIRTIEKSFKHFFLLNIEIIYQTQKTLTAVPNVRSVIYKQISYYPSIIGIFSNIFYSIIKLKRLIENLRI
jgi:hypothetical protein